MSLNSGNNSSSSSLSDNAHLQAFADLEKEQWPTFPCRLPYSEEGERIQKEQAARLAFLLCASRTQTLTIQTRRGERVIELGGKPPLSRRNGIRRDLFCVFCKNNGEEAWFYRNHVLRDGQGLICCPVLRKYDCPICHNGGGDWAHTVKYCPKAKGKFEL